MKKTLKVWDAVKILQNPTNPKFEGKYGEITKILESNEGELYQVKVGKRIIPYMATRDCLEKAFKLNIDYTIEYSGNIDIYLSKEQAEFTEEHGLPKEVCEVLERDFKKKSNEWEMTDLETYYEI